MRAIDVRCTSQSTRRCQGQAVRSEANFLNIEAISERISKHIFPRPPADDFPFDSRGKWMRSPRIFSEGETLPSIVTSSFTNRRSRKNRRVHCRMRKMQDGGAQSESVGSSRYALDNSRFCTMPGTNREARNTHDRLLHQWA